MMARRATGQRRNNLGASGFGGSYLRHECAWTRRLTLEPLEERSMLAVTLHPQYIRADEGLAGDYDDIPRLSGYDKHNADAPVFMSDVNNTNDPNHNSIGFTQKAFFKAKATGGFWSQTSTWENNVVPTSDSDVVIPVGSQVTYDLAMTTSTTTTHLFNLEIAGKLTFKSDANTVLRVGTLYVLPAVNPSAASNLPESRRGELVVEPDSTHSAEIVFTAYKWGDTNDPTGNLLATTIDTKHFTGGLIAYGVVNINGAKTLSHNLTTDAILPDLDRGAGEQQAIGTWSYLTGDALVGSGNNHTITLAKRVDWKQDDWVVLPDTRRNEDGLNHTEWLQIQSVDHDGDGHSTITFKTNLQYDHKGYTSKLDPSIGFKPVAGLLSHNAIVRSDVAGGGWTADKNVDRGHTLFGGAAIVHITFAEFKDLGRTDALQNVFVSPDFSSSSPLTPNTNNQNGRYAVHFHHVTGPTAAQITADNGGAWISKSSFVFAGNSIWGSKKWAMALHDANWGDIRGNVIYDAQGAGIVTEDGSEIGNQIVQNFITNIYGAANVLDSLEGLYQNQDESVNWLERQENSDVARGGTGIWMRRSGNDVVGNVTMDTRYAGYVYTSYYLFDTVNVPTARGLDKSVPGNFASLLENPTGTFKDNTAIGKSERGGAFTYISGYSFYPDTVDTTHTGAYGFETPVMNIENLRVFNITLVGMWVYHTTNVKFTGLSVVIDTAQWTSNMGNGAAGLYPGEGYENFNLELDGGVLEGNAVGFVNSVGDLSAPEVYNAGDANNPVWRYKWKYLTSGPLGSPDHPAIAGGMTVRGTKLGNWINVAMRTSAPRVAYYNTVLLDGVEMHEGRFGGAGGVATHSVQNLDTGAVVYVPLPRRNLEMDFTRFKDTHMLSPAALLVKGGMRFFETVNGVEQEQTAMPTGDKQIYFGEQADTYTIQQSDANGLLYLAEPIVGQPGFRTNGASEPKTNGYLWSTYGLAAAGAPITGSAVDYNQAWNFVAGYEGNGPTPIVRTLEPWLPLPGEGSPVENNPRLALVTPWDGAEVIVPVDKANVQISILAQINGGLKVANGSPTERVLIRLNDITPGVTETEHQYYQPHAEPSVLPWHTYQVDVDIVNAGDVSQAHRRATFTVVKPHITSVSVGHDGATITIPGSNAQLRSINADNINTVAITFNQPMNMTNAAAHKMQARDLRVVPVAGGTIVRATGITVGSNNTYSWTLASPLAKGQYFIELSNAVVDADLHPLTGGWFNPRSIGDAHLSVGGTALDGTHASQFSLAITIFPGDTNQDNIESNENLTALPSGAVPLTSVVGISFGNSAIATGYQHRYEVQVGSSAQLDVVPILADTVYVQFSQPMRTANDANALGESSLWFTDASGYPPTVVPGSFTWDRKANTASWRLAAPTGGDLAGKIIGVFTVHVAGTVVDQFGHSLDGEWINSTPTLNGYAVSGNGQAGGEFKFKVFMLPYDISQNRVIDFEDLGILLNHYNQPGTFMEGDLNSDGMVDFVDLGILFNWYDLEI